MNIVPLDIPSAQELYTSKNYRLEWPVNYDDYRFLSYEFVDLAVDIAKAQQGDTAIALISKLSDILLELVHLLRLAVDFQAVRQNNIEARYDPGVSLIYDWIVGGGAGIYPGAASNNNPKSLKARCKAYTKAQVYRYKLWTKFDEKAHITFHHNILLEEDIARGAFTPMAFLVDFWVPRKSLKVMHDFAALTEMFMAWLEKQNRFDPDILTTIKRAMASIINGHMNEAVANLASLKASGLSRYLGRGIASGTPKYQGRLLSWYCLDQGKDVIRYAHGGERVFYEDYFWPLAELPYCSQYIAHSQAEAERIKTRVKTDRYTLLPHMKDIDFLSKGSLKHQKMLQNSAPALRKDKILTYVANIFTGDLAPNFPAFKVPDPLYLDWQIRLLKFLRAEGWRIQFKPHPKGAFNQIEILKPYVDEIIAGPFAPQELKADIILYDFAGTAFFDGLASHHGICLLNLGGRPLDPEERLFMERRCAIYECGFDQGGRVALEPEKIRAALAQASTFDMEMFARKYFY